MIINFVYLELRVRNDDDIVFIVVIYFEPVNEIL